MRKLILILVLTTICAVMAGCASKHMQATTVGENESVLAGNQSAVVFFRDSSMGGAVQAPIVESKAADVEFVSILSANTKVLHKTVPGKHIYIIGGESSNMLDAVLAPQKFYYVRVTPKMGLWKARFVFEPVLASDEKLQKALSDCTWVASGATAKIWFSENKKSMQKKFEDAAEGKRYEERAILNHGNGFDALVK